MSVNSGFFNAINGDRTYNADDLSQFFDGIISDGVFKYFKNELKVTANNGLSVRVLNGKAIVLGKYVENSAALDLDIEGGNSQPRYDAIVVSVSLEDRQGNIYVKQGIASSAPTPPTLYDTPNSKEICLAYVYVGANASQITESNIIDKRDDTAVCGYVKLTNVSAELKNYRNNYTTSGTESVIPIGISQFDAAYDTLLIYKNGILLEETNEYLVQGTGSEAKVHLSSAAPAGQGFTFVVLHLDF